MERIYTEKLLKGLSKQEIQIRIDIVKASIDLTDKERDKNIEILETILNGGASCVKAKQIKEDMKACEPDISDIIGH